MLLFALVCLCPPTARAERLPGGAEFQLDAEGVARLSWQGEEVLRVDVSVHPPQASSPISMNSLADQAGGELRTRERHWSYFHLEEIVFWELRLPGNEALPSSGVVNLRSSSPMETIRANLSAHRSVGSGRSFSLELPLLRVKREGETDLFVTVLRSDGRSWRPGADEHRWQLGRSGETRVALALVVADSEDILWHNAGQALLTGELGGAHPLRDWVAPPLCARCAEPVLDIATLSLRELGTAYELQLRYGAAGEHAQPSHGTLHIAGIPLAEKLLEDGDGRAFYRLELTDPQTRAILKELRSDHPRPSLKSRAGQPLTVRRWSIRVPEDERKPASKLARQDLPHQLSPELLEAWPNPFAGSAGTTIRYTLPKTVGEAFDLDEEQRRQFKLDEAPPFGLNPAVTLRVYNVQGQLVRELHPAAETAGSHEIFWDGKDDAQRSVAAGAYFVRMELGEFSVTRRAILLKQ